MSLYGFELCDSSGTGRGFRSKFGAGAASLRHRIRRLWRANHAPLQDRHVYCVNPWRFFLSRCRCHRLPVTRICSWSESTSTFRLPPEAFHHWWSRWVAAKSSIAIGTGPLIRMRVVQSPVFERIKAAPQVVKAAVIELLRAVESLRADRAGRASSPYHVEHHQCPCAGVRDDAPRALAVIDPAPLFHLQHSRRSCDVHCVASTG